VVAFGVFVSVLPLFYILLRTAQIGVAELAENLFRARTLELIYNSLSLTLVVCITAMTIGTAQAWLSFRSDLAFRRFFQVVAILPLGNAFLCVGLRVAFGGFGNKRIYWILAGTEH
jgi:iron(III) transport system permease protein